MEKISSATSGMTTFINFCKNFTWEMYVVYFYNFSINVIMNKNENNNIQYLFLQINKILYH